jgi:hypothetical protein
MKTTIIKELQLSYDLVRSNRQDRQRYFQLVKSLVYLRVTFTKYLYCLLLQSSHSADTSANMTSLSTNTT